MTRYFKKIGSYFKKNERVFEHFLLSLGVLVLILFACLASYFISYSGKIYPNIYISGISISGNNYEGATSIITEKISILNELNLMYQDRKFPIKLIDIGFSYNLPESINLAYNYARTGNFLYDLKTRISLLFSKQNLNLKYNLNEDELKKSIAFISEDISEEALEPSITINGEDIVVSKGSVGKEVDQSLLIEIIKENLALNNQNDITIPVKIIDPTLTPDQETAYVARASKYLGKEINITFEYNTYNFKGPEIIQLLDPSSGYRNKNISDLINNIAASVERDPQNSKFNFAGGKVVEFQASLDGISVNDQEFKSVLIENLEKLADSDEKSINFSVPVNKTPPQITTDEVNNLGIEKLIGRGSSTYYHSITSRVHNVALAASRINGTLVKPGETFSFNQALGEVSGATGYQQAYIISEGRTILGDGGGVCQVSTTLFRALLDAGLTITERQSHAYRVSYYEQDSPPGLDATVYSPSPDLKFINDTPGHILIQAIADTKNYSLVFELYGTDDGRISTVSKPIVSNVSSPPEDLYQDDPTLPAGTIKQIDWKAWGAKVTFNYKVTKNGKEIINKTFISNYKPWQAIYLKGTGPIVQ